VLYLTTQSTGTLLVNLGSILYKQGKLDDSKKYHEHALKQFESTTSDNHMDTADACYALARNRLREHNFTTAK